MDRDGDFDSSLMIFRMLGPVMGIYFVFAFLVVPLIIYLIARWRDAKQPTPDPQLGLKIALSFFAFLGFQALLAGGTLLIYTIINSGGSNAKSDGYRFAFGLLVPGGLVYAGHTFLMTKTNQVFFTGIRRLMLGFNLVFTGILGFVALVGAFEALFARESTGGMGKMFGAMLVVYGGAWMGLGIMLARFLADESGAPPVMSAPPGSAPPPAAPTSTPPGLPSLGGGSFPPINQP
jgi:hypothetical protein